VITLFQPCNSYFSTASPPHNARTSFALDISFMSRKQLFIWPHILYPGSYAITYRGVHCRQPPCSWSATAIGANPSGTFNPAASVFYACPAWSSHGCLNRSIREAPLCAPRRYRHSPLGWSPIVWEISFSSHPLPRVSATPSFNKVKSNEWVAPKLTAACGLILLMRRPSSTSIRRKKRRKLR
jgi:hypothetical protein